MDNRVKDLQEQIIATCVGHDMPVIMAALTLVHGAMIGMYASSPKMAREMAKAVGMGVLEGVKLVPHAPEVH